MSPDCRHTSGFKDVSPVDPQPGQRIKLVEGVCIGCNEVRYLDNDAYVYVSEADARAGVNAERRIGS